MRGGGGPGVGPLAAGGRLGGGCVAEAGRDAGGGLRQRDRKLVSEGLQNEIKKYLVYLRLMT